MQRRTFIGKTAILTTGFCFGARPEPIIGHYGYRYRIDQRWCRADAGRFPVNNCHELAMDKSGRIFMTTDDTRNNILIFNKDGAVVGAWGKEYPGAHGLTLHDENGTEVLYITDYERHQVIKTSLEGKVIRTFDWPEGMAGYQAKTDFSPTETAIAPNGDVFVADGYGKDFVLQYSPEGVLKRAFGGPGELKNAHGIALDTRDGNGSWLVTSRADNTLKRFDKDGMLIESIPIPGAYICRPVVVGENVYFAVLISHLPWDSQSGFVCILDKHNQVVSAPGANIPRYEEPTGLNPLYQAVKVFKHPHDVLVDADGNILVAQWNSGHLYPIKLNRV